MKKVGIVSCYFKNNYGSKLQAYATQKILDNLNLQNETFNIDKNKDFVKGKKKFYKSQIFNFPFIKSKFGMLWIKIYKKINKELGENLNKREKKFKEFEKEINLSKYFYTYKELNEASKRYSSIIVGSDQLWLPVNVVADYYTLNWVDKDINKVALATSFGISEIPNKYKEKYKDFLNKIDYISVREESGCKIVKDITGKNAELVCDPTMLLTKQEWEEIQEEKPIINEEYILCYFLGKNIEHRKFAEKLKNKTGYKIVSLNHCDEYVKYSDKFADITPYDIGPKEFLNLIRNAKYVCTDSFHGTVFSLINNVNFFTFERYKSRNSKISTNSRIYSLLKIMNLESRILKGTEEIDDVMKNKINFENVNEKLKEIREKTIKFLNEALKTSIEIQKNNNKAKYIQIDEKNECCGCTACKSICPQDAIKMQEDEEGFLYPKIDKDKCVNCGLCKQVCPIKNKNSINSFKQKAYVFQNMNENVRLNSAAGGFFNAIGNWIIENGGIVFGANFNKDFIVEHSEARTKEDLKKFRNSKYVQSDLKDTFKKIKEYLQEDKLVCFSGTPCQVAGLVSFLGKKYDNLVLVDIMCHSVPSPLFFEKYKKYILKKMNAKKILSINFRDKTKYGYKYSMMTIVTDNGTYSEGVDTDPYLRAFFGDLSVRPSCYNCQFKTQQRVSDITIWDCFNVNEIEKSFNDDKGTTRILVQSNKGYEILNKLDNIKLKEIQLDIAINKVKEMTNSVSYNKKRKTFFNKIDEVDFIESYFPINFKTRINSFTRKLLNYLGIYSVMKTLAKKILNK